MTKELDTATVGEIVARDRRSAAVFARYGIDFCCGGGQRLTDACRAKNIDAAALVAEIDRAASGDGPPVDATSWTADALVDLIVSEHHTYVRREVPSIESMLEKIVSKHGVAHPELAEIAQAFDMLADELYAHMEKEEGVLFPYIASLVRRTDRKVASPFFGTVRNPIRMMKHEHVEAAALLGTIQRLTNQFTPPAGACATWKASYAALEAFDRDLREHVHLENNVLFPAATRLEDAQLSTT